MTGLAIARGTGDVVVNVMVVLLVGM